MRKSEKQQDFKYQRYFILKYCSSFGNMNACNRYLYFFSFKLKFPVFQKEILTEYNSILILYSGELVQQIFYLTELFADSSLRTQLIYILLSILQIFILYNKFHFRFLPGEHLNGNCCWDGYINYLKMSYLSFNSFNHLHAFWS